MNINDHPHKRYNPLTDEWILVSPHRARRPWQGKVESLPPQSLPPYDEACYLCPGNMRVGGTIVNPPYRDTYVFDNDFQALLSDIPQTHCDEQGLLKAQSERGICRVICFSPRHDLTLARMDTASIRTVVDVWIEQYQEMGSIDYINYVQIFENRGDTMGCSNPHPHGQIWSNETVPLYPAREHACQEHYLKTKKSCLLCDYIALELKKQERVVFCNDSFAVLVPYWACWPFEVLIAPTSHLRSIAEMNDQQKTDLADAMRRTGIRYDNLFETSFPYSMGIHQQPTDGKNHDGWHFHLHYYPPLLRSATVKKFMVGYEMLAMPQRDITAEQSAERLRQLSETHYLSARA